jgi:hypothetical protein
MVTLKSYVKMSAADIVEWPCLNMYIVSPEGGNLWLHQYKLKLYIFDFWFLLNIQFDVNMSTTNYQWTWIILTIG